MNSTPLVSVCCLTYNHAPFIRKCLDGFLMQETTFSLEILIHDDASTDGTDEIIREYTSKYPDRIFPLFETENKYSRGYRGKMDITFNYSRARGKYIATCEGDDYWTDPKKLQKQVTFLESNPDYSVCWHRYQRLYWYENTWKNDDCGEIINTSGEGKEIDIATFLSGWYTQALTMVFRKSCFSFDWYGQYKFYRDEHEMYHLLTVGKGYLFDFIGGVYVIHSGGVYGAHNGQIQSQITCDVAEELYVKNKNNLTRDFYKRALQWAVYQHKGRSLQKIAYSWKHFILCWDIKQFIKNLLR